MLNKLTKCSIDAARQQQPQLFCIFIYFYDRNEMISTNVCELLVEKYRGHRRKTTYGISFNWSFELSMMIELSDNIEWQNIVDEFRGIDDFIWETFRFPISDVNYWEFHFPSNHHTWMHLFPILFYNCYYAFIHSLIFYCICITLNNRTVIILFSEY